MRYCYYYGIGTSKDNEKAFLWFLKSTEGGNRYGQCNLGYCYRHGIGTTKDEEKAFQWSNNLGYGYQLWWYLKLAEGEDGAMTDRIILGIVMVTMMSNLGSCHTGGIGTIKDKQKAFLWNKLRHRCHNCDELNLKIIRGQIRRINYSKFKNIEYLDKGGCSIWKSEYIEMPEELFEFHKSRIESHSQFMLIH
ncbi:hypothetical protein Glove_109g424 [Diversispora epigaea]|uniref:Uncharacterized protein n=1 Tax=Diversispora epigaea TaxID=1348612 RepID=A0A397JC25_9GLOM|nr:hypothetical protein Glove_109g424 [Diversispora epigaea]